MHEPGAISSPHHPDILAFERDGGQRFRKILDLADLKAARSVLADVPLDRPGIRIFNLPALDFLISPGGKVSSLVHRVIGRSAHPVRMILFDKNSQTNRRLTWHQDRTIAVKRRIETQGYGPWTLKAGMYHVAPPIEILAGMVTARIHLDPVDTENAPLLIALGSHRLGPIPEAELDRVVAKYGTYACLAEAGDVWLNSTPIVHASEAAKKPKRRRVLQVDYANCTLPNGLEWLGV